MLGGKSLSNISIIYDLEGKTNDTKKAMGAFKKTPIGKEFIKNGYLINKIAFILTYELACFPISRFKIEIN